jgi:FAD/FMN-containing dehydrogenase
LRARLEGELLLPSHDRYEETRKVWNGMIDKRPAVIARCAGVADVVAAVAFAREHDLLVSVRGGGHSVAGKAVCNGGLMIDLSRMRGSSPSFPVTWVRQQTRHFDAVDDWLWGLRYSLPVRLAAAADVSGEFVVAQAR